MTNLLCCDPFIFMLGLAYVLNVPVSVNVAKCVLSFYRLFVVCE